MRRNVSAAIFAAFFVAAAAAPMSARADLVGVPQTAAQEAVAKAVARAAAAQEAAVQAAARAAAAEEAAVQAEARVEASRATAQSAAPAAPAAATAPVAAAAAPVPVVLAAPAVPTASMDRHVAAILDAASAKALVQRASADAKKAFAGRKFASPKQAEAELRVLLSKYWDSEMQGRSVLGRFWTWLPLGQRTSFAKLLEEFIVIAYGGTIDEVPATMYVDVQDVAPLPRPDGPPAYVVSTYAGTDNQDRTDVLWTIEKAQDGRLVVSDVRVDGVSPFKAMREEFSSVVRRTGGVDGLLLAMRSKVTTLSAQER